MKRDYLKRVFSDGTALTVGIIYAALCLLTRLLSSSPYEALHRLNGSGVIPPLWMLNLLSVIWCFLAGFAAGIVYREIRDCYVRGREEIRAYQGGLFFISLVFLSLIWYPLLFSSERVFWSVLIALAAAVCSALSALFWRRVSAISTIIIAAYSLWLFYLLTVNIAVLLKN